MNAWIHRATVLSLLLVSGCGFHTTLGPAFTPLPRNDVAIVYLYRPYVLTGSRKIAHVVIDGDERLLLMGSYAAMIVTPGRHTIYGYATFESQNFVGYGYGPTALLGTAVVDVQPGSPVYVRVEAKLGNVELFPTPEAQARGDITRCGLAPGGSR